MRLVSLDTEATVSRSVRSADDRVHSFRLGTAIFRLGSRGYLRESRRLLFTSPSQFWEALDRFLSPRETTYLYAHNVAYDLTLLGLWDMLINGWGTLRSFVISDPPTVIHVTRGGRKLIIADTLNYWRLPLSQLGESIGLPKLDYPGDDATESALAQYCWRDTEIIDSALTAAILRAAGNYNWSTTSAGLAWSLYRTHYLHSSRRILIHADPQATAMERAAYLGGYCTPHRLGDIHDGVTQYDCNSMYPSAMAVASYPVRLSDVSTVRDSHHLQSLLNGHDCCAVVRIKSNDRGYIIRHGGHLVRAEGCYDTVMCGAELRHAVESGHVARAWDYCQYETDDLFSEYVHDLFGARTRCKMAGDLAGAAHYKMLLNSIHGKFAQSAPTWIDWPDAIPPCSYGAALLADPATRALHKCRVVAYKVQRQVDKTEWIHSFPAIPAMVTSMARQMMFQVTSSLPAYSIYYEDADSLHVSDAASQYMLDHSMVSAWELGKLKEVGHYQWARYHGPRDYQVGGRRVCSQVSWKAEEVSDGVFLQDHFEGLTLILATPPTPTVRVVPKRIKLSRDAYITRADREGWIAPLVLEHPWHLDPTPGIRHPYRTSLYDL